MIVMPPFGALVATMAMQQRRIDQTPCYTCGGDRLRADFVTPGVCHVGGTATT